MASLVGRTFLGRYDIVRPLGEGNMGKVYLASRRGDGVSVVVKVMHDHLAADPKFRELFEREMQFMARFKHPNIVELLDASTREATGLGIVMEYVDGTDLEHILRLRKRLPLERVGRLLGQLASALQYAHSNAIIHRDLKPGNLMIMHPDTPDEQLKVMDFGLAKLSSSVHIALDKLKGEGATIATGTPEYIAPEQVRGDELDHRSDLYAVGVILFELLTGQLPFRGQSVEQVLLAHAESKVPSFAEAGAALVAPREVEALVMRCLSKFPVERPKDAWEIGKAFEKATGQKILQGAAPQAPQAPAKAALPRRVADPNAWGKELDAWMPERIAVVKLKGYVDDMHGEVVESVAGKIVVLFGQQGCNYLMPGYKPPPAKPTGPLAWLGIGPAAPKENPPLIEMELLMDKKEAEQSNVLHLIVSIRPQLKKDVGFTKASEWNGLCEQIFKDLRAYLITK